MAGSGRRGFLRGIGVAAAGLLAGRSMSQAREAIETAPVNATERLMSEHGLIQRLMICFEEAANKLESDAEVLASPLLGAGSIVDEFVGMYHEELEEQHIFRALEGNEELAGLILTLRRQHAAGRRLTARMIRIAGGGPRVTGPERATLAVFCRSYARMYRAHAAYEDTLLMPALRKLLGADAFGELSGQVAEFARNTLGVVGLEDALERVRAVEAALGIGSLEDFTAEL